MQPKSTTFIGKVWVKWRRLVSCVARKMTTEVRNLIVDFLERVQARSTKYVWFYHVERQSKENVANAIVSVVQQQGLRNMLHTMTADNGREFADHAVISSQTGSRFYFATPYHSWERGLNEHTNGLLRQYLPKGTDFMEVTQPQVDDIAWRLNNRTRKVLGSNTPQQRFMALKAQSISGAFQI